MIEFCSLKGVRETNQDALAVITAAGGTMDVRMIHHDGRDDYTDSTDMPDGMEILLVADGMGGLENGDQASFLTLNFFLESVQSGFRERIDMTDEIRRIVQRTSDDVRDNCPGSGSTLVGMLTHGRMSWIFSVGDSKCIAKTSAGAVRSENHSLGDGGIITAYIGMEGDVPVNVVPVVDCGNAILFSDGLNPVFEERGTDIADSNESAEFLCRLAVQKGSTDNVTCIIRRDI